MGRKFRVKDNVKQGIVDYRIDEEMFVGNEYKDCFSDIFYKGDVYEVMNEHIIDEYGTEEDGELIAAEGLLEHNDYPDGTIVQLERMGFAIIEGVDEGGVRRLIRLHG